MNSRLTQIHKWYMLTSAFARQDTQSWVGFLSRYLWAFFACVVYRFIFAAALSEKDIPFEGQFIGFALFFISGVAFMRFIFFGLNICEETLANLRSLGLVNWILVTPTSLWELIVSSFFWRGLVIGSEATVFIVFGRLLLETPLRPFLHPSIFAAALLMILTYLGIGMMVSGCILLTRRGAFLIPLVNHLSILLGGVYFPVQLLPESIHHLSPYLPITNALNIIRLTLTDTSFSGRLHSFITLTAMAPIFLLLGCTLLQAGLIWARKNGRL